MGSLLLLALGREREVLTLPRLCWLLAGSREHSAKIRFFELCIRIRSFFRPAVACGDGGCQKARA